MTDDRQRDNRQLQKWLLEMGLGGSKDQHSLGVVTDAESSVGNFISSAGLPMGVVVERAPPQGHQANGTAERTIREIKEGLKTSQLDFQNGIHPGFQSFCFAMLYELHLFFPQQFHDCSAVQPNAERLGDWRQSQEPRFCTVWL